MWTGGYGLVRLVSYPSLGPAPHKGRVLGTGIPHDRRDGFLPGIGITETADRELSRTGGEPGYGNFVKNPSKLRVARLRLVTRRRAIYFFFFSLPAAASFSPFSLFSPFSAFLPFLLSSFLAGLNSLPINSR